MTAIMDSVRPLSDYTNSIAARSQQLGVPCHPFA